VNESIPEFVAHALVDTRVAEDDEGVPARHDEEEDAVAVPGSIHSESRKCALGCMLNTSPEERRQRDANLSRSSLLDVRDGALHPIDVEESREPF
jgi:hypothetical protein